VQFTDRSADALTWAWVLGDGGVSEEQNPFHEYTAPGSYEVSLTVTNDFGTDTKTVPDCVVVVVPPPSGAWFFDEGAGDIVHDHLRQYGNDGWLGPAPSTPVWTDDSYAGPSALQFDGVDDYVQVPNTAPASQVTLEAAVKVLGTSPEPMAIISRWAAGGGGSYVLALRADLVPVFDVTGGTVVANAALAVGEWHRVMGTYDGSMLRLYIDGALAGSAPTAGAIDPRPDLTTSIGRSAAWPPEAPHLAYPFDGIIDEVRILDTGGQPPVADFVGTPTQGVARLTVQFSPDATLYGDAYWWDFGDNSGTSEWYPTHRYTTPGCYTVTLTAYNDFGTDTETKADYIRVAQRSFDDDDRHITYTGRWTRYNHPQASGGHLTYSGQTGARATLAFYGTGIKWYTAKANNLGKARVWVDGTLLATVDLYSTRQQFVVVAKTGLSRGCHTVVIEVTGRRNPSSNGYLVAIDGFEAVP
jgi:PKD repeat protein